MRTALFRSRLLAVGAAGILAAGVIGTASISLAQEPDGSTPPAEGQMLRKARVALGLKELLKNSGVTHEELAAGIAAGQTLGQIIDASGDVSSAEAKAAAIAALETRLDEAVANGRLTQERADEISANAPATIDALLAAVPAEHMGPGHGGKPRLQGIGRNALETVAEVLGRDVATIAADLRAGQTVAQIAGDQTPAVTAALIAEANAGIDKALADGKITAEQAETLKSRVEERVNGFVNNTHQKGPGGRGGFPGRGPGGAGAPAQVN